MNIYFLPRLRISKDSDYNMIVFLYFKVNDVTM